MRTTINLEEALLSEAQRITGMKECAALIHEELKALVERESTQRLALLGGGEPQLKLIPRRRPASR